MRKRKYAEPDSAVSYPMAVTNIDERNAIVTFVVATSDVDRSGDILVPAGCLERLASYQANPVWFFNHDIDVLPVGKCEDEFGNFALEVQEDKIYAQCKFHLSTCESRDVYALLCQGYLKGASVSFIPHEIERLDRDTDIITDWELLEISVVGIPDNPEALVLESAAVRKAFGGGMAKKLTKAGAQALHKVYSAHKALCETAKSAVDETENDKVQKVLSKYAAEMDKSMEGLGKSFSSIYPDVKMEDFDKDDEDKEVEEETDTDKDVDEEEVAEVEDDLESDLDDDDSDATEEDEEEEDKDKKSAKHKSVKDDEFETAVLDAIEKLDKRLSAIEGEGDE